MQQLIDQCTEVTSDRLDFIDETVLHYSPANSQIIHHTYMLVECNQLTSYDTWWRLQRRMQSILDKIFERLNSVLINVGMEGKSV